ncbi:LemA family protein [Nocardioides sp. TRM66260-LWL]|uniref:LemA family protein n=1 Tax=Nocardioides sp. TRM66260-LWL TaxID=2874478 RepID=UPI001CC6D2D5|nr:LemA family protein [Nocardioides sp. TRM66260-LWL]MBZ5736237.1 LemA family protein [Nocardioides sp. TRM66260-LWL]
MIALAVAAGVVLLAGLAVIVMYNRFGSQQALIEESWSGIDVELTRRHDLVPNLVATVRGYAAHEAAVLAALTDARESAVAAAGRPPADRAPAEDALTGSLGQVLARAEAYPDLKASAGFLALQRELVTTEDRIAAARRFFNGNVRAYNARCRTVPSSLVASAFGFRPRAFFEIRDVSVREVPDAG